MKIDWIEGTITKKDQKETLASLKQFFIDDWQNIDRGGLGYECSAVVLKSGRLYWSMSRPEMGVHVSLPASALAQFGVDDKCSRFLSFESILSDLASLGMKFTRIDLALDDLRGTLDLDEISKVIRAGNFVTRWKRDGWQYIENGRGGRTWYFGSVSSDARLRIYDKASEQNIMAHWIRVELQLRRERANAAVTEILGFKDTWKDRAAGWILGYLDFKIPGADSHRSRWDTAEWWLKFLDYAKKMRIFVSRWVANIEDIRAWLKAQVTPSLYVVFQVLGWEAIYRMIEDAAGRLKPKHLMLIDSMATLGA